MPERYGWHGEMITVISPFSSQGFQAAGKKGGSKVSTINTNVYYKMGYADSIHTKTIKSSLGRRIHNCILGWATEILGSRSILSCGTCGGVWTNTWILANHHFDNEVGLFHNGPKHPLVWGNHKGWGVEANHWMKDPWPIYGWGICLKL